MADPVWNTNIYDPFGNLTVMAFQTLYETQRQIYHGGNPVPGALVKQLDTCYNGSTSPCDGTVVTLPISSVSVITTLPRPTGQTNSVQSEVTTTYNVYGLPTEADEYDWGAGGGLGTDVFLSWSRVTPE